MSDKKISQLTASTTPLAGTETLAIVQSGTTKKASIENVLTSVQPSGTANGVTYLNGSKVLTSGTGLVFDGANLGVGASSPSYNLEVRTNNVSNQGIKIWGFSPDGTKNSNIYFGEQDGTNKYVIRFSNFYGGGTYEAYGLNLRPLADNVDLNILAGTEAAPILGVRFKSNTGNVGFGIEAPTEKVDVVGNIKTTGNLVIGTAGKGIDFSADGQAAGMTSELLDDYEEGTWTPDLRFDGVNTGITYVAGFQNGLYTKVGNLITVTGVIYLSNKGSATGNAAIYGLPYGAANLDGVQAAAGLRISTISNSGAPSLNLAKNGTYFTFSATATTGVTTAITNADFANNSYAHFSMTYRST